MCEGTLLQIVMTTEKNEIVFNQTRRPLKLYAKTFFCSESPNRDGGKLNVFSFATEYVCFALTGCRVRRGFFKAVGAQVRVQGRASRLQLPEVVLVSVRGRLRRDPAQGDQSAHYRLPAKPRTGIKIATVILSCFRIQKKHPYLTV